MNRNGAPVAGVAKVHFWDAGHPSDRREWVGLWRSWPGREVSAHPSYVELFAQPGDRVICAAVGNAAEGILYPVIVRPLSSEPWAGDDAPRCDLTTAYGYAGPYAWGMPEGLGRTFWDTFEAWARAQGAITEFARLSLFEDQMPPFHGEIRDRGPNVVRILEAGDEDLWSQYEGKVRRNVKRARREGVEIDFDARGDRLDDFLEIYADTMRRRQALSHYFFPRSFFESIIADLPGQFVFAHARLGSRAVSTALVLLSTENAYYFLGGTRADAFSLRPHDLLQHEVFRHCRDRGLKRCILGGGYRGDDGILRFKRSFAPGSERPFRVGAKSYDEEASARLVERRRAWEREQGREWNPAPGYFPAYRS